MTRLPISHPAVDHLLFGLRARHQRLRSGGVDKGASAVEWIVISAIVVGIVIAVGVVIKTALDTKAAEVANCIESADGGSGSC